MRFFMFLILLLPFLLCIVEAQGSVQLYTDSMCDSPEGSPISGSCIETHQAGGVVLLSLPSCTGNVYLIISDLIDCKRPSISPFVTSSDIGTCLFFPSGSAIGSAGFICEGETDTTSNPSAAAETSSSAFGTTTTSVHSQFSSTQSLSTSTTSDIVKPALTTHPDSSVSPTVATTTPTATEIPWTSEQNDSSSTSNNISLGVGIGLGLPSLIIAFVGLVRAWKHGWLSKLRGRHVYVASDGRPPPYDDGTHWYQL